ncbi:MAG: hypothetical protein IPM77_17555 [Crocinitomicaceae bacterium]|nr:hypothetical protein [Crocinitomicaceae bacterium]
MITKPHHFHIPVMGIGYTIDTPVKVAHLGIDSVISLVDDGLIEKMRAFHSRSNNRQYHPITIKTEDYRAKRITAYLNLLNELVNEKFMHLMQDKLNSGSELDKYIRLLPDSAKIKVLIKTYRQTGFCDQETIENSIKKLLTKGSIDVNIMSKGDTVRYKKAGEKLPIEFNDAHAAVRGFLLSDLENSSLIISSGLNPKLFSYIGTFKEILPDENGVFRKKIIIKVSDYRSALVQGKFLAQRGVWVSEFRLESGLNCGGHAFATKGYLMGPILDEFNNKREELELELRTIYKKALADKGVDLIQEPRPIQFTAQGGVGTAGESEFLREHYGLSSIGWGSPFLLVPEVVSIDKDTLDLVAKAEEGDVYLSDTSPFGIPFYTLKGNTKDKEKLFRIMHNAPGSTCPKRYVALNTEFGEPALCTASKEYQTRKIKSIKAESHTAETEKKLISKVTAKTCVCVGLGTAALLANGLERRVEGETVSICPGPNVVYFSKKSTLEEMVDHIYGRKNLIEDVDRSHVFVNELKLYVDHFETSMNEANETNDEKEKKSLEEFKSNLFSGIKYYQDLFMSLVNLPIGHKEKVLADLNKFKNKITFNISGENKKFA